MANFNNLLNCSNNNLAHNGANSDITSLTGLTGQFAVSAGGTGAATFTANGLLVGNGTSAVTATAAGTNGQLLLGQTASAPTWNSMSGDATITQTGVLTVSALAITGAKIANNTISDTQITANGISNTSLAQMAANTIKGNNTAGLANAADLTKTQMLSFLGISTFTSADQVITSGGSLTLTHGLGATPSFVNVFIVCQVGENGYSPGDVLEVLPTFFTDSTNNHGLSIRVTSTQILIQYSSAFVVGALNASTGSYSSMTNGNWKLRIQAAVFK